MGYEIDFMPVGDESMGGDAICLRFGNLHGAREEQFVAVVDGGFEASGRAIVEHLSDVYGTDRIDVVLNTHPDNDHTYGLKHVLTNCEVGELWMHLPANHRTDFASPDTFSASFRNRLVNAQWDPQRFYRTQKGLERVTELISIASERDILIVEPFAGLSIAGPGGGSFEILGPTLDYYESLLDDFGFRTPRSPKASAGSDSTTLNGDVALDSLGPRFETGMFTFVQVPHHGSRRNVGPKILNRLLGQKGDETETRPRLCLLAEEEPEPYAPLKESDQRVPPPRIPGPLHIRPCHASSLRRSSTGLVGIRATPAVSTCRDRRR